MKQRLATLAILSLFGVLGTASASVIGHLNVAQCANGGVTVTATTIDWLLPVGGGVGCIQADTGTTVTYNPGGLLTTGEVGTINDLNFAGTPAQIAAQNTGFMTFSGPPGTGPAIAFNLVTVGPGSIHPCTGSEGIGDSCSIGGNTPIILTKTATGTSVTLSASGLVSDVDGPSTWTGSYTTQFAVLAPIDIQNFITGVADANTGHGCVNLSCTSTYSGTFDITVNASAPEPGSFLLIGGGLLGLATTLRRRKK